MNEPSHEDFEPEFALLTRGRWILPVLILLVIVAAGTATLWELYGGGFRSSSAPSQDTSAQIAPVVKNLETSQQQAVDQIQALQQDLAAQQAETKRLSDEVAALNGKVEALQQSFASAPAAPAAIAPAKKKPPGPAPSTNPSVPTTRP